MMADLQVVFDVLITDKTNEIRKNVISKFIIYLNDPEYPYDVKVLNEEESLESP